MCLCPQSNDMIKLHKEKISTEKENRNFFWIEKARVVKTINPHIGSHWIITSPTAYYHQCHVRGIMKADKHDTLRTDRRSRRRTQTFSLLQSNFTLEKEKKAEDRKKGIKMGSWIHYQTQPSIQI